MKRKNLILSLFFGSIFITSIEHLESAHFFNSYKKEIFSHQELTLPIAFGEASGKTFKEREEECITSAKRSIDFFKRELIMKEDNLESTEKTKNKIKNIKNIIRMLWQNKSFKEKIQTY